MYFFAIIIFFQIINIDVNKITRQNIPLKFKFISIKNIQT